MITIMIITKRLSWEGNKLRDLKDSLDLYYKTKLNPQRVKLQTERVFGEVFSQRSVPPNAPAPVASSHKYTCAGCKSSGSIG